MNIQDSLLSVIDSIQTKLEDGELEVVVEFAENQTEEEVKAIKEFILDLLNS